MTLVNYLDSHRVGWQTTGKLHGFMGEGLEVPRQWDNLKRVSNSSFRAFSRLQRWLYIRVGRFHSVS